MQLEPQSTDIIVKPERARCTAKSKQTGERCRRYPRIGYDVCTMHGAGKGDKHPGEANIKHGRYSRFLRQSLEELQKEFIDVPNPNDLSNELAMLRALLQHFLDTFESNQEALLAWHWAQRMLAMGEDADEVLGRVSDPDFNEQAYQRPARIVDIGYAVDIIDSIGALVARMEKVKAADALPRGDVLRMAREMENVARSTITDPDQLEELLQGWRAIRVGNQRK